MNKYIAVLAVLISMSCITDYPKTNKNLLATHYKKREATTIPYHIKFEIDQLNANQYALAIAISLEEDSYFVSPFSKGNYKGRFTISIDNNDYIKLNPDLLETPPSVEQIDLWQEGLVQYVKENTKYQQSLTRSTSDDFQVTGTIRFVIEPSCTLEEIAFIISSKEGQLKIENKLDKC